MKPGRPTSHIKAKWITWSKNGESLFYELDVKGNLIKSSETKYVRYVNQTEIEEKQQGRQHKKKLSASRESAKEIENALACTSDLKKAEPTEHFKQPELLMENILEDANSFEFFQLFQQIGTNLDDNFFDQHFGF